jgi:eukaryotic-like serine/threonine-protein kinase
LIERRIQNGTLLLDKLEIIDFLGGGNFGQVYLAKDIHLNNMFKAIKIINEDKVDMDAMLNEARALQKCKHKHIVDIYGADKLDSTICISMKYLDKGTLQSKIDDSFLSAIDVWRYFIAILFGLECIHHQRLLHRDIKPANILFDGNNVVISDLGLCAEYNTSNISDLKGYIAHLAPEAFTNKQTSIQTDIYAVGMTMFRCVNNIKDFIQVLHDKEVTQRTLQTGKIIDKIGFEEFCPTKLRRIIKKACQRDPSKRYQSAEEMRNDLNKLRPNISWSKENTTTWNGHAYNNSKDVYKLEVTHKKGGYIWIVKRNTRQIGGSKEKFYQDFDELLVVANKYIADTSFII